MTDVQLFGMDARLASRDEHRSCTC
jgi:hypothetical protein